MTSLDNNIYNENCLATMKRMEDNSIDSIITDPPYGYKFMGKNWDKAVPSVEIWQECLRVLKPGAFMFVMSAPRQDVLSRMIVNIEDAGFRTDFSSLRWLYASGFPKALNISKAVDKKLGTKFIKEPASGVGFMNESEDGYNTTKNRMKKVGKSCTEAKELNGSYGGFQPKPACEIIIVAMKPLSEKTYTDQVLKNGKGVTWLDDCRIPFESEKDKKMIMNGNDEKSNFEGTSTGFKDYEDLHKRGHGNKEGRFPANILVSDDILNDGVNRKSGTLSGQISGFGNKSEIYGTSEGVGFHCDSNEGSFSRFFDLDKWWSVRVKELLLGVQKTFPNLLVPKASKSEKNEGCEKLDKNNHPTVKPVKLMSYLVTLGSRMNDIVYDPFMGSGTTAVACVLSGRKYVGSEMSKEYCDIIEARVNKAMKPITSKVDMDDIFG